MIGQQDNTPVQVKAKRSRRRSPLLSLPADRRELGSDAVNRCLTRKEAAVLRVLMDPSSIERTDEELMRQADVSCETYYRIKRDPWVQEQHRKLTQEYVANHIAPILKASIQTASTPGRDGWQDRRFLSEYSGFYVPRKHHEHNVTGKIVGIVGVSMTDV